MNKEEFVVLIDSQEAATYKTGLSGWVSRSGRFWGEDERMARFDGCTHKNCDTCGGLVRINSYCRPCYDAMRDEKFKSFEIKEWDGQTPLNIWGEDVFFFCEEDLEDYCIDNDITPDQLQLVFCIGKNINTIDEGQLLDSLHEDAELPKDVSDALDRLNKAILAAGPQTYFPGNIAARVSMAKHKVGTV